MPEDPVQYETRTFRTGQPRARTYARPGASPPHTPRGVSYVLRSTRLKVVQSVEFGPSYETASRLTEAA